MIYEKTISITVGVVTAAVVFLMTLSTVFLMTSCTEESDEIIDQVMNRVAEGEFLPVKDNGVFEQVSRKMYKWLTGNNIGSDREDLFSEYLTPKEASIILQNVVEVEFELHKGQKPRLQIIEEVLVLCGYDKQLDGKIVIESDESIEQIRKDRVVKIKDSAKVLSGMLKAERKILKRKKKK